MESRIELEIQPQPHDAACGPTCLHAVYRFFGAEIPLEKLLSEVALLETGGTLAVHLACHALRQGFEATIYTYNLNLFDPTWFRSGVDVPSRLEAQAAGKNDPRLRAATRAYLEFFALGGRLRFQELSPHLIRRYLKRSRPILTGLSATYLYGCAREVGEAELTYDDVAGVPVGHFVVLYGYDRERREVLVADPLGDNPRYASHYYSVGINRVIGAILLGVLTYDANFLVLQPAKQRPGTT